MRISDWSSDVCSSDLRHRTESGNTLRAAVLGANDGLVSNVSLVMGMAGAASGDRAVLLAGLAGLVAGACSMALGEWLLVNRSPEFYQEIGTAACRERVGQYVQISGVAVTLKQPTTRNIMNHTK